MKFTKSVSGWGSAPGPAGGASSAPPDPLAGGGGVAWGRGGGLGEGLRGGGEGEREGRVWISGSTVAHPAGNSWLRA